MALSLERRKARGGDDGEAGESSRPSRANAAADHGPGGGSCLDGTVGGSSSAYGPVIEAGAIGGPSIGDAVPGPAKVDVSEAAGAAGDGSPGSPAPGETGADTGQLTVDAAECRAGPTVSAGSAGSGAANVASALAPA